MKRFLSCLGATPALLLLLMTGSGSTQAQVNMPVPPNQLRVLSYNIHHCNPPAKRDVIDVDAIANVIRGHNPDLVALQEVDVKTDRAGNLDQAQLLAKKTNMKVFFAKAINFEGGEYGIAILSRFPILESHNYPLPSLASTKAEPRVLATVRIKTPAGVEFIFANTHLDSQKEETNRLLQIEEVRKITGTPALPTILAGDFNAVPSSHTIKVLDGHFQRTCDECGPTIPADKPRNAIDFIAYKPVERIKVISHEVIAEPQASDHRPVMSVLQLSSPDRQPK